MRPTKLKKSLFTVGSVDNIGHNQDSFRGTVISHTEHLANDFDGIDRN